MVDSKCVDKYPRFVLGLGVALERWCGNLPVFFVFFERVGRPGLSFWVMLWIWDVGGPAGTRDLRWEFFVWVGYMLRWVWSKLALDLAW